MSRLRVSVSLVTLTLCLIILPYLCRSQDTKSLVVRPKSGIYAGQMFYTNSHALLIGIRQYANLPKEKWRDDADAKDLREVLIRSYGFLPESEVTRGRHFTGAKRPKSPHQGDVWMNPKDGAEMVFIPAGPFQMGDDDVGSIKKDNPRHTVTLSGYWIYKNVVTVRMFKKYCRKTGKPMPLEPGGFKIGNIDIPKFNPNWSKEDHPIVNVSWEDAKSYCVWAGVALPTEAQWEKAAGGTKGRKFPWGDAFDLSKLWCSKSTFGDARGTAAVGRYGKSPYGLSDMAGNVWQWCADWYDANFWSSRTAKGQDPQNQSVGDQKYRVVRGGSWINIDTDNFRSALRNGNAPDYKSDDVGFRGAALTP